MKCPICLSELTTGGCPDSQCKSNNRIVTPFMVQETEDPIVDRLKSIEDRLNTIEKFLRSNL